MGGIKPAARISRNSHAYYRSVIVPLIRDHCGYESDADAHRAIKAGFYGMHPYDPKLPSMAGMPQEEASRLMEYALREAAELSLVIPDPEGRR